MFVIRPLDTEKKMNDPIRSLEAKRKSYRRRLYEEEPDEREPKKTREILLGPRLRLLLGDAWTRTRRHGRLFSGYIGSSRWPDLGAPKTALVTPPLAGARNVSQMIVL